MSHSLKAEISILGAVHVILSRRRRISPFFSFFRDSSGALSPLRMTKRCPCRQGFLSGETFCIHPVNNRRLSPCRQGFLSGAETSSVIVPFISSQSLSAGIPIWSICMIFYITVRKVSVPVGRDSYLEV